MFSMRTASRRPAKRRHPDKRYAILRATLELVAAHGFHGAAMSKVARRARVSAGIIYHYFPSKDALIRALYRDVKLKFSAALAAGDLERMQPRDTFLHVWMNAYRYYAAHGDEIRFIEQYEGSPFNTARARPVTRDDPNLALLLRLFHPPAGPPLLKDLPGVVLNELSLGVAARVAKSHGKDRTLDRPTLDRIAAACWQAIAR